MPVSQPSGTIRLTNNEDGKHEVPADVLARTLSGMQKLVYLVATVQEQRGFDRRFRVSQEIQQKYTLCCQLPQSGSYAVPFTMGTGDAQMSLLSTYESLLESIEGILSSIYSGQLDDLVRHIPDGKLRNRVLLEVRQFLPKVGEGWQVGFQRVEHSEVLLTADKAVAAIDRILSQDTPEDTVMTVTGELIRIDFDKQTVVLRYPPTRREIECLYVDELEETMLENRRELIQATGQFTLDEEGNPIKLTGVIRLGAIDLSPLSLKAVSWNTHQFRFMEPLVLQLALDESKQLFVVEEPDFGLYAFAQTREQLVQEIAEQIAFMWDAYVNVSEDMLASDALRLRQRLLQTVSEEEDAA
jgi:hypothetical protein